MAYDIYSKAGADEAISSALADSLPTAPADIGAATAAQGAKADASDVDQITLTGDLVLTLPVGRPAGQVYRCAITQDGVGGHTVTYGGNAVAVGSAAGAETLVEIWPGGAVVYPGAAAVSLTGLTLVDNGDGTWTLMSGAVDSVPPSPGTLAASLVTQNTLTLTASGAADAGGLHATPYAFSINGGTTYSAWQAAATYAVSALDAGTTYTFRHKVRDASGNESEGAAITQATAAGIAFDMAVAGPVGSDQHVVTIDLSGATIGSTAFMYVARNKTTEPITVPDGWALVGTRLNSNAYTSWCWSKVLGAGDIGVRSWEWGAEANYTASHAVAYRGATSIAGVASAGLLNTYSTSFSVGSLTTAAPWVVALGSCNYGDAGLTLSAPGYTVRSSLGASVLYVVACDSNGGNTGPTAAPTITTSASVRYRGGYLIALN